MKKIEEHKYLLKKNTPTEIIIGPQGISGTKGDQGIQGPIGLTGSKGDKGDRGEQGDIGLTGLQGPKGEQGDIGLQGPEGPSDRSQTASFTRSTIMLNNTIYYECTGTQFISDVQKMVSGEYNNYGWLLKVSMADPSVGVWQFPSFMSSDYTMGVHRPYLQVTYQVTDTI
jgi:hypothetical protein